MTDTSRQAAETVAITARQALNTADSSLRRLAQNAVWLDPRSEELTLTLLNTLQQVDAQASQLLYALQAAQYQAEAEAEYMKQQDAEHNTSDTGTEETEPIEGEDQ